MARWSSGQDTSLSRWEHGFDSRTGHQKEKHLASRGAFLFANSMESEPRVFPLAEIHKTCGALHFIFTLTSSARGGSDSRILPLSCSQAQTLVSATSKRIIREFCFLYQVIQSKNKVADNLVIISCKSL